MLAVYIIGALVVLIGMSAFFGAPYVPSHRRDVKRLFDELTPIDAQSVVLDIGSGDGLVLREVSRRGGKGVGYEIHPLFVLISRLASWGDGRVSVRWVNAWTTPFPDDVNLVYIFSVARDGKRLMKLMRHEATRLHRPLSLVCYGSALPGETPVQSFEAYYLYTFEPLHSR